MDIEQIEKGIEKTGFRLEFDISSILEDSGWNVINNKYYVDDQQETVREVDIVAYKASLVQDIYVYTALIISCKKSEKNAWALLSKKSNHNDPNMEWVPIHAWSNDRILSYMLEQQEWKNTYLSTLRNGNSRVFSDKPERHIFGFQEMNKESGAPQNDKNIFNSITSVMKAQAYEMNALPIRKKVPCAFQFNLISIAQAELVRLDFEGGPVTGVAVDDEVYVADYIIDKQQTFAKVHFIKSDKFRDILEHYNQLHKSNLDAFKAIYEKFCDEITKDHKKLNLFQKNLASELWWPVYKEFRHLSELSRIFEDGWLGWNDKENVLEFEVDLESSDVEQINLVEALREKLSQALKKYYKYEGKSRFAVSDIPF
ncbi:hypothetical protein [Marinobacter sp. KMM 10035]|uniref:hypothetical protein n=1 Tax=Marinobacter sp. KMM 10035 TaxID=3134034 RepID=UPI0039781A6E